MSTQTTTTITTSPVTAPSFTLTLGSTQPTDLGLAALGQTEQMNNQLHAETNKALQTVNVTLATIQKNLEASLQENLLLKKEIVQLNTKISENEKLHATDMKEKTETIKTLVQAVNGLKTTLNSAVTDQNKKIDALVVCFNSHNHTTPLNFQGGYRMTNYSSSGPSTPYTPEKK